MIRAMIILAAAFGQWCVGYLVGEHNGHLDPIVGAISAFPLVYVVFGAIPAGAFRAKEKGTR